MKKTTGNFIISLSRVFSNLSFISQLLKQKAVSTAFVRILAVILITALLAPMFLFNPIWQIQAKNRLNLPVSAPPEPFVIGSAQSGFSSSIFSSLSSVKNFFQPPQLPEGFENAKVPTFSERMSSVLGATFGSILSIGNSSVKKNEASNLPEPSNPLPLPGQFSSGKDFDFDGDGYADIARWHASNTEWKIKNSLSAGFTTVTIGSASSIIAPGDFDGDGKTDAAVFNAGTWTIRKSTTGTNITVSFGAAGDKPVVGDYDGDGTSDEAVYRPSTNQWWILYSYTGTYSSTTFGSAGDITAQGKFDGDNKTDIAIFRPASGDWHIQGSTSGYYTVHWGAGSDIPAPADYTGDGKADLAVFRGSTGTWYVLSSADYSSYTTTSWGNFGDQPVPADYDNDGKADYAVWRPTTGTWYIINSYDNSKATQTLGVSGDTAVQSAYLKQIGSYVYSYDFAKVRLSPKNATGGTNLYSRNFSWGTSLVGLPGRAGLDAGFGISYNSLVWTKDTTNNAIVFDADNSNVTPGFRFGFPTIEPVYFDAQTGKFSYLMVTPSGSRVEFRQSTASNLYETGDSGYTQLKIDGSGTPNSPADSLTLTVTDTGGTNMLYEWKNGAYRCKKITDRNGNYIEIIHDADGKLQTVTDTLGRDITVNYNSDNLPSTITQTWKGSNGEGSNVTHTWASFTYTTQAITTNFSDSPTVIGPGGEYSLKVLQKITFPTESNGAGPSTVFSYNTWGQVKQITNYAADNHELNHTTVNLPANASNPQPDCPRFTETRSNAQNFNGGGDVVIHNDAPVSATYTLPGSITGSASMIKVWMDGDPNNMISRAYVGSSGWQEGLPIATEDCVTELCSGTDRKRWTWSSWTQDDTNLSYIQNPRVEESKVGDTSNIKRTKIYYEMQPNSSTIANYGRVKTVEVYDAAGTNIWQMAETVYNDNTAYISRRMVNLPSVVKFSGFDQVASQLKLVSMATYAYDGGDFTDSSLEQNISSVIKHDNTNFSASFIIGRGNLTGTTRCDVDYDSVCTNGITSSVKYNIAGGVVAQINPLGRTARIGYGDNFNDTSTTRNTYAYPTRLTELAYTDESNNNYSDVQYRFDMGANVWAKSPVPTGSTTGGKETVRNYDAVGRLERETISSTGAYTRYEYPTNNIQSRVFTTLVDNGTTGVDSGDEVLSEAWTDGAGRVRRTRTEHPGSANGWMGTVTEYNILGQVTRSTVPTEIYVANANDPDTWVPGGDDNRGVDGSNPIWLWKYQKYDWKGRVTRIINTDGVDSPTLLNDSDQLISYDGCGCAGGQVTTIQSELVPKEDGSNQSARRTQKVYEDILGRTYKTEVMGWNGTSQYTTTVQKFNGRNQVLKTIQYPGPEGTSAYQQVSMSYDGFGRMTSRRYPVEDSDTTWSYNADDSIHQTIDPRSVITDFTYNSRGLVSQIQYTPPSGHPEIPDTPDVTFTYDALGNRKKIDTAGVSEKTYVYNELSQLKSETVDFDDLSTNYTISYTYNLSGGLKSITDPFSSTVNYTNDKTGRVTTVVGTPWAANTTGNYASGIKYRAFGQIKQMKFDLPDDTTEINLDYDTRLRASHFETTSSNISGGYLMKGNFTYEADGRVQAKDDLLNNSMDRTMKYDFAGRLIFNQFGLGMTSDGLMRNIYEQSIAYDEFSHMLSRGGNHWNITTGFVTTYANGRDQNPSLTYDAAGNITAETDTPNVFFQNMIFDASGRRTATLDRWRTPFGPQQTHAVHEDKSEIVFDGDGIPVIEKKGTRTITQNPPPLVTTAQKYQIWSTVLGSSLTTIRPDGNKAETRVFAGSAVIAKQKRVPGTNGNWDSIEWTTSDPVTNSAGKFFYDHDGEISRNTEESEPLGQKVSGADPVYFEPTTGGYENYAFSASDAQWQCEAPQEFYGGFNGMPDHCQKAALYDLNKPLTDTFGWRETSVKNVNAEYDKIPEIHIHGQGESQVTYAINRMRSYTLSSSTKKKKEEGITIEAKGNIAVVQSEGYEDNPIKSNDAENSGDDRLIKAPTDRPSTNITPRMLDDKDCRFLMNALFGSQNSVMAGLYNPPTVLNSSGGKPFGEGYPNGEIFFQGKFTELATHIYGGIDGTKRNVSLYLPANPNGSAPMPLKGGYTGESQLRNGKNAFYTWGGSTDSAGKGPTTTYAFEYSNGLTVVISHVGEFDDNWESGERNRQGSFRIGFIGGPGGDTNGGIYIHSHLSFFRNGKRVDPRVEFCSGNYRLR